MAGIAPFSFGGTSRYEPRRQLGQGGFGIVYEVFDRERSRPVALKLLRVPEGENLSQFKDEFRLLRGIAHDNLVALEEFRIEPPYVFFTMELVDGAQTILSYLRPAPPGGAAPGPRLDVGRLRAALPQLAGALMALHGRGIIHRDIKPSNVLVAPDGRVVVLDFGIASALERDGLHRESVAAWPLTVLGTPAYMAPEHGSPEGATAAIDWYSLGVILYEALTGQRPFAGDAFEQLEAKQTTLPRPPHEIAPDVAREWSNLCVGLLEPDPRRRLNGHALVQLLGPAPEAVVEYAAPEVDLVGRDAQLDALADAYETARNGQTVVALVSGHSGMGKTALIEQFIADQRILEPRLLALRSRCYERESVPYKAIDPIVDTLSRYLRRLPPTEVRDLVPRDAAILTRVFPALLDVREFQHTPDAVLASLDSTTLRQRAATALRELVSRIAMAVPLVIAIDDAQWGDADSAALLPFLLSPPDSPRVLLIASYRSEDITDAPLVAALSRLVQQTGGPPCAHLSIGPLKPEDSRELARRLAGPDVGDGMAEGIAQESGGSPFFVYELARHAVGGGGATRLEAVVGNRVSSLSPSSRALMAAVALSAQAIPLAVAEHAAAIGPSERPVLGRLTVGRLVRSPGGEGQTLEPYHDRIREAVVAQLSDHAVAQCHRRLAEAWEQSGKARPGTLATHFAGAGDISRATVYAEHAALQAAHALAFDQAAEFYRLLLRLNEQHDRLRDWWIGLGDALVNDGRGKDAADSYQKALQLTPAGQELELETRAAAELIRAGYLSEALVALERLLPKVGIRAPASDGQAVLTLIGHRALVALRGIRIRERPESEVPPALLRRIDVLVAIGAPLSLIALPRGLALNMQATWHALRAGERRRAALGLALLAATTSMRGTKSLRATLDCVAAAKALAEPIGDPYTTARTLLAEGIALKVTGRWKQGVACLDEAIALFTSCPGSRWEIETAQTLRHDTLIWTGDWKRLAHELPARRREAEQRGDLYSVAHVTGRLAPHVSLMADRPLQAEAEADEAERRSSEPHYNLQSRAALCARLDVDLYAGHPHKAADRLTQRWPALKSTLRLFQSGRIEVLSYRARVSLALAASGAGATHLQDALRTAGHLERERAAWATALATLTRAAAAAGQGDEDRAKALLETAEGLLLASDMRLYAAAAAFRLGALEGGDGGRQLMLRATATLREENTVKPEAIVDLLCPWPSDPRGITVLPPRQAPR